MVNPGPRSGAATRELLREAHRAARARHERRAATGRAADAAPAPDAGTDAGTAG